VIWVQRFEETGSVAAKPSGGSTSPLESTRLPRKHEIAGRYRRRWVSTVDFIKMCLTGFAISAAIIGSAVAVIALAP
jgi:hypothetical protein